VRLVEHRLLLCDALVRMPSTLAGVHVLAGHLVRRPIRRAELGMEQRILRVVVVCFTYVPHVHTWPRKVVRCIAANNWCSYKSAGVLANKLVFSYKLTQTGCTCRDVR
jgi:hypothetical protein